MSPGSDPPRTQVDATATRLREAVLAGTYSPGERLREVDLATEFGVSRHTLRAALRALRGEGLVSIEPHRGARVARLDGDELREMFELRVALEVEAVRLLRERHGLDPWPPSVQDAATNLVMACSATEHVDQAAIDAAHAALHHALVRAAGSARITAAHAALTQEGRLVLLQSRAALPPDRMAALHLALLRDLRVHGPEALREHLRQGASAAATPESSPPPDRELGADPR